ncbi:hypothetical protein AVEN_232706-1 [Araneus ventricosus]|uniref:BTB domain-containing protein n=1 Tax=Araneus ventricosus TaxID=182803 RepID=A0A4Y2LT19_ARAVE|nr:hypothetical protein AVEN_232706-1 [Araneus ventricosus]
MAEASIPLLPTGFYAIDVVYEKLQLPTVTAKAFGILLEYMYTGQLKVTCQDLSDVYRSARKLGMKGAMKECIELLSVTTEDFQNMVYLYVTARQLKQWECTNRAFKLLVVSFERLVMTKQFLDLEVEQILELFSSNELGARR